jgi:protein-disulfide isomerase
MKKLLLAITVASCAFSAQAADLAKLNNWASRALPKCPDGKIAIEPVQAPNLPSNFQVFVVTQTSSDKNCGGQKYLLYSPRTDQTILGTVITLPDDPRPTETRINEVAKNMLKTDIKATIAPFPLPDGLRSVAITKSTPYGPFSYHALVDQSQHFLIIGTRGNLKEDPGKSLVESLGMENAVRRGNSKSKIQIIELSDFECPTCGRAHKTVEPIIAKSVGKIDYARLDLPLFEHHEWAMPAALGGRAISRVAPSKYWDYVNFIFENQETIGKQPFDKVLKDFVADHDIDWKAVERVYTSPQEKASLLEQVSRAFDNGVISTPTYIINGQVMGFGPEGKYTVEQIQAAIASAGGASTTKGTAKKK